MDCGDVADRDSAVQGGAVVRHLMNCFHSDFVGGRPHCSQSLGPPVMIFGVRFVLLRLQMIQQFLRAQGSFPGSYGVNLVRTPNTIIRAVLALRRFGTGQATPSGCRRCGRAYARSQFP